ncbi:hypothetical protein [Streptomyces sp. NPDC005017]|uniref:hypothetical protein n=1 Tax=Streptomyces sp. NPDC005017 TaxID=3364706 RepID=UPI00369EDE7C
MGIVNRGRRATVWLLPALAAAACTSPAPSASAPPAPRPTADVRSGAPTTTAPARKPVEVEPPALDAGGELAGQQRPTRGNAVFAYGAGPRGKALVVVVSCRGEGEITVALPEMRAWFDHICTPGEPAVVRNEFAVAGAHRPGTVSVRAPSTVVWAATVGRGEPTETD